MSLYHSQRSEYDLIVQNSDWFPCSYTNRRDNPSSHGKPRQHGSYRRH